MKVERDRLIDALAKATAALQIALANYSRPDSEQCLRLSAMQSEAESVLADALREKVAEICK